MIVIDRDAIRVHELAWSLALLAELGHEPGSIIAITREYLHSIILAINDEQETSMMVERQASRAVKLVRTMASLINAKREFDSSLETMSKRIATHTPR